MTRLTPPTWPGLPSNFKPLLPEAADQITRIKHAFLDSVPAATAGECVGDASRLISEAYHHGAPSSLLRDAAIRLIHAAWVIDCATSRPS